MSRIRQEPVVFWGTLTSLIEAIIGLLAIFGVINWTTEQMGAVMLVVAAVGTMFAFFVRSKVAPVGG